MMNRNYMVEINVKIPSTHMVTQGLEHGEICLYTAVYTVVYTVVYSVVYTVVYTLVYTVGYTVVYTVVTRINVVFCLSFNFG